MSFIQPLIIVIGYAIRYVVAREMSISVNSSKHKGLGYSLYSHIYSQAVPFSMSMPFLLQIWIMIKNSHI
jgi:hypothetical protein